MRGFQILFQDDQILVIDKMAGIVVTPADTIQEVTISDILTKEFKINLDRGGVVHRLDKDTSGVLVIAKTLIALENLQAQFKGREVKKEYLALVHGYLKGGQVVKGAIARNPRKREKFIVWDEEGKEAETRFIPVNNFQFPKTKSQAPLISNFRLQRKGGLSIFNDLNNIQKKKLEKMGYGKFTLVKCYPMTGRTHQIRVHLKHIGFPIVSDDKYGGKKTVRLDHRWCPRQFLHARSLEIAHPATGKHMVFESPLPEDLKEALEYLEIEN